MQIELTDENEWNNHIDAGDVALEFLTTTAAGTLVFARGPISGDFLEIKLINRQRARATMNLGEIYVHVFYVRQTVFVIG